MTQPTEPIEDRIDRITNLLETAYKLRGENQREYEIAYAKQAFKNLLLEARLDELKSVQSAANIIERMDACGCDNYTIHRIASLQKELGNEA
jgi:hypothetical protein